MLPTAIHQATAAYNSGSSSLQSNDSSGLLGNPKIPQTHLKSIALQEVPLHAQARVAQLIDALDQSNEMDHEQAVDLAKSFVSQYKNEPAVTECVFKYLTCRFMLDQHVASHANVHQRADKSLLKKSMTDLRAQSGSSSQALQSMLKGAARLGPVVTSHPTQLNRPESNERLLSYPSSGFESEQEAHAFADNLWMQAGRRIEKPTVLAEATAAKPAVKNILQSMRKNAKVLMDEARQSNMPTDVPLLEAGNWIAGDRDGNPTVTPALLGEVMAQWSDLAFDQYLHKVSDQKLDQRPHCLHRLFEDAGNLPHLKSLKARLQATRMHVVAQAPDAQTEGRFRNPQELADHVHKLKNQLNWQKLSPDAEAMVLQKLDQLALWANTFGFHGVSTHIRQNSEVNQQTVDAMVKAAKPGMAYAELPEDEKVALLMRILNDDPGLKIPAHIQAPSTEIQKEIEFLGSYKGLRDRFGEGALPTVITANTETLSDMLEVCVLLKHAKLTNSASLGMNVVPLIETVPDMKNARQLMTNLLDVPKYRAHLQQLGNVQRVMLGYSDSMRGNGIVSAAWEGHKIPAELKEVADPRGVKLHFFHGRGGTEARGSRDNYADEIAHVDGGSLDAGYTQTEQGEEVFKKFGNRALSDSNISELISSTLQTNARGPDGYIAKYGSSMESISTRADAAYQTLYQDPGLASFLQQTTPLPFVGLTNAGSRPASRIANLQGPAFLAKLRAIPYVAAWYQSGSMAPAYFGLGSGIEQHINDAPGQATAKINELQGMYKEWPFFKNLIDRAETAMNKADMVSAQRYANLNPGSQPLFDKVKTEYERTRDMINLIKGQNTAMHHSVQTNPLRTFAHTAQAELLGAAKSASASHRDAIESGIVDSMRTIAAALHRFG
ncbi:MAG TPA: phosphoenolpyruvate carboxylase [Limnobacter sp.]|nr:phosphoenolpyruvate carboxylase [Limnobacter sp.]